ncbi:hypothetical protein Phi10:1_gp065 [Cellulophaga phage phi10:1]|uniref:Uncharacterized protein n=1 Tax=Cellulophaga phage phi10:1 TaxID=1327981 RepID=R9ZZ66_9CAUD|nr:hypothetical protein Phi10:1_gp065 [Cellulophaga phage phi10:1]AGO48406.1 hypothetical protein Phi10:1_gp065 [Cellulophaga phage phi10:1]
MNKTESIQDKIDKLNDGTITCERTYYMFPTIPGFAILKRFDDGWKKVNTID